MIASFHIQQQRLAHTALKVNRATILQLPPGRAWQGARREWRDKLVMLHMNNLQSAATYECNADVSPLVVGAAVTGLQALLSAPLAPEREACLDRGAQRSLEVVTSQEQEVVDITARERQAPDSPCAGT